MKPVLTDVNCRGCSGDPELFSAAVAAAPFEQPEGVHQEGSLLGNLQHYRRESSTNTGAKTITMVWICIKHFLF